MKRVIYKGIIAGRTNSWILFDDSAILAIGSGSHPDADETIDAGGNLVLPGAIDVHCHFREPGLTYKATIRSESRAAFAGGVTTFFDMPNTVPQTTSRAAIEDKTAIARRDSVINYAFYIGATNNNLSELLEADYTRIPGVKLFLGSSTGNMLVDDAEMLDHLFGRIKVPIVVHAEDEYVIAAARQKISTLYGGCPPVFTHSLIRPAEACIRATRRAIELCCRHPSARLHIAHVTTAAETEMIRAAKNDGLNVTAEVSPHHLLFSVDDYERLGARIKMNPSVKTIADREALRQAVLDGTIDIIATDHAPHTLEEKTGNALTAVSGAPMVQFSVAAILDLFGEDVMQRTMCENPARIFNIYKRGRLETGYYPDIIIAGRSKHTVTDNDVISKCGWTPLIDYTLNHRVTHTFCNPKAIVFDR